MRLAVFKVNMLGDNVVFLPTFQELVRVLPSAEFRIYTAPVAVPLYENLAPNARVVGLDPGSLKVGLGFPGALLSRLTDPRRFAPDVCLASYDNPSLLNLLCNLSGASVIVAQENSRQRIKPRHTHLVPFNREERVGKQNWKILPVIQKALHLEGVEIPSSPPAPDFEHMLGETPARVAGRVVIHPGASLPVQRWFLERYLALARRLGEKSELEVCWVEHDIKLDQPLPPGVRKIAPGSIPDLARLLASANLFIGNNTGPMHLAYSLGTPSIIPCGPSQRTWDPAWNADRVKLLRHPTLECLPCDSPERPATRCFNEQNPMACMKYWGVEEVLAIAEEMLRVAEWKE